MRVSCWGSGCLPPRVQARVGTAQLFPHLPTSPSPSTQPAVGQNGLEGRLGSKGQTGPSLGAPLARSLAPPLSAALGPSLLTQAMGLCLMAQRRSSALISSGFSEFPQGHLGDCPFHHCSHQSHLSPYHFPLSPSLGTEGCYPTMTGNGGFSRGSGWQTRQQLQGRMLRIHSPFPW